MPERMTAAGLRYGKEFYGKESSLPPTQRTRPMALAAAAAAAPSSFPSSALTLLPALPPQAGISG